MKKLIKIIVLGFALIGIITLGLLGYAAVNIHRNPTPAPTSAATYTGQDILSAVNAHRKEIGVQEVVADAPLCNNIVGAGWSLSNQERGIRAGKSG